MWAMHTPYKLQLHPDFAWIQHLDLNISSKRTPSRNVWLWACPGNISDSPGNHEGLATPLARTKVPNLSQGDKQANQPMNAVSQSVHKNNASAEDTIPAVSAHVTTDHGLQGTYLLDSW